MKYFLDLGKTLRVRINLKLLELKYKALVADLKSKNFDFRSSFFKKLVADIYPTVLQGLQGSQGLQAPTRLTKLTTSTNSQS